MKQKFIGLAVGITAHRANGYDFDLGVTKTAPAVIIQGSGGDYSKADIYLSLDADDLAALTALLNEEEGN